MQGVLARFRGPYTPSQWLELEHQALIYKYSANVPVPSTLLIPIRRSLSASGFSPSSAGSFGSVGWGSFYLAYCGYSDLEPGGCRRTDGKKCRCSRDAVADQKYCERHMNRDRHHSCGRPDWPCLQSSTHPSIFQTSCYCSWCFTE